MKQNENKATYVAPSIEIIEMENEGTVMSASSSLGNGFGNGGNIGGSSSSTRRGYNSAASSDLEDMINDILTIEN